MRILNRTIILHPPLKAESVLALAMIALCLSTVTVYAAMDAAPRIPAAEKLAVQQASMEARAAGYVRFCYDRGHGVPVLRVNEPKCAEYVRYIRSELEKNERALEAEGLGL